MLRVNHVAVAVSAISAFILSSLYYGFLVGGIWRAVDPAAAASMKPSAWMPVAEILRTLVIAYVIAHLVNILGRKDWKEAVGLALWLWFGFSAMMWIGAIMWEKTPWQVAMIHSGDWLFKTVLIAAIIGIWRK